MRLRIEVEAQTRGEALDRVRARNAVIEPLEEDPDVEVDVRWLGGDGGMNAPFAAAASTRRSCPTDA